MKLLKTIVLVIIGLILTLNAFLLPFQMLAFSPDYYIAQFTDLAVHESIGIDLESLEIVTNTLIDHIDKGAGNLDVEVVVNGEKVIYYNEKEQHHLHDIYLLVKKARTFLILANLIMVILFLSIYFMEGQNKHSMIISLTKAFKYAVFAAFGMLLFLTTLYFVDFDMAFRKFHEIFFTNDLWLLDPRTDRLIQLMPLQFFINFTRDWLIRVALLLIVYILIGFVLPARSKFKKDSV